MLETIEVVIEKGFNELYHSPINDIPIRACHKEEITRKPKIIHRKKKKNASQI